MLARVLGDADAARRGEDMLKRLNEVDEKIDDLVASTDESASEVEAAEGLKIDVEANIEITNQAIRDLSAQDPDPAQDEDQEPGEAYPPLASAP
jgi:DNA-directed RNA polymerase specialized sigma subunit